MPSAYLPATQTPSSTAAADSIHDEVADNDTRAPQTITAPPGTRAVVYLRVSSSGQVNTDYDPEGISIPAQRVACVRKIDQLGLNIVGEYVEPGRSATEITKRIKFQEMLARIRQDKDVDFVIVYKLSRFARNRIDDAIVMADLRKRGVTLISATEHIDDTPVGRLMHGILAAFNEYRSDEDGADIAYKMGEKAKKGGTLGRAPIGYLNVIDRTEGREIRTVAIDPERAPLIRYAFETYAQGDVTVEELAKDCAQRGLLSRRTAKQPSKPIPGKAFSRILRNPYYVGVATYKGEQYRGRHEAIVDQDTFDTVQRLLESRRASGERRRIHHHLLKGTLYCGRCHKHRGTRRRMVLHRAVGNTGTEYFYFFCMGIQDNTCDAPFTSTARIEEAVERHYDTVQFAPEFIESMRDQIERVLADTTQTKRLLARQLKTQLAAIDAKEANLVDLAAEGDLPTTIVRQRITNLQQQRDELVTRQTEQDVDLEAGAHHIRACLEVLADPQALYTAASDDVRRQLNQAIFTRLYIDDDEVTSHELTDAFDGLMKVQREWMADTTSDQAQTGPPEGGPVAVHRSSLSKPALGISEDNLLSAEQMVELRGLEPLTPTLPVWCATSCAIAPCVVVAPVGDTLSGVVIAVSRAKAKLHHRPESDQIASDAVSPCPRGADRAIPCRS
jgi:site-specific DNA recombinase